MNCRSYDLQGAFSLSRKTIIFSLIDRSVDVIPSVLLASSLKYAISCGKPRKLNQISSPGVWMNTWRSKVVVKPNVRVQSNFFDAFFLINKFCYFYNPHLITFLRGFLILYDQFAITSKLAMAVQRILTYS